MNSESYSDASSLQPLRMWPALALMAVIVLCRYVPPMIEGASSQIWFVPIFFPMLASALILVWWLAGSRATGREKFIGFVGFMVAMLLIVVVSHPSMRGLITSYLTLPLGALGFGLGAYLKRNITSASRGKIALVGSALAMCPTLLLQSQGITGDYVFDLKPRWVVAPGDAGWAANAVSASDGNGAQSALITAALAKAEWPGFRGADRMGNNEAAPELETDWTAHPPKLLWKKPIGAGWSSFAVAGDYAFTQEQRGVSEIVACYDVKTGAEVWVQQREGRFEESMGGPGPRATPTLAEGRVYTVSALGILQCLEAGTAKLLWEQNFKALAGREPPMWGYASSPLVTHSLVVVFAGGAAENGVMAFDAATGEKKWSAACGPESYSSPQLSTVLGEEVLLVLSNDGLSVLEPVTGKVRLRYEWKFEGYRALQPTVVGEDIILLPTPMSEGTRAIRLRKNGAAMEAEELWTSKHMKPDFTELIAHQGFLYGIDGSMFSCLDLKTGERVWKDGRYGKGQALLLGGADQILIAAETGRIALLQADPTAHREVASFQALKGKTWNHPVLVGNRLLIRNASEAACYELRTKQ